GFTRKAAPSACSKSSHYPRRSQNTPGENDLTHAVYGGNEHDGNRDAGSSERSFSCRVEAWYRKDPLLNPRPHGDPVLFRHGTNVYTWPVALPKSRRIRGNDPDDSIAHDWPGRGH